VADYVYPSVYFAYLVFFLSTVFAVIFCVRSLKDGYWGPDAEEPKHRMLADEETSDGRSQAGR
jgi:hypothetical protein